MQRKNGSCRNQWKKYSDYYTIVSQNRLIPVADALFEEDWSLKQVNAFVYKFIKTKELFVENIVEIIPWLAK